MPIGRVKSTSVALLVAIIAFLALSGSAMAHSQLVQVSPAADATLAKAPKEVVLKFDTSVGVAFGGVRVYGPNGDRVDDGRPVEDGELIRLKLNSRADRQGTYAVAWRAVSADSHPIRGAFVFHVGEAEGTQARDRAVADSQTNRGYEIAFGISRALVFLGILLGAGGVLFYALVQPGRPPLLIRGALITAAVASISAFVLDASLAGGFTILEAVDLQVLREQVGTTYGRASVVRALLCITLLIVARHLYNSGASPRGRAVRLAGVLAGVTAASISMSSHALAADPIWLRVPADMVHSLAAAVWMGGLFQLVLLLRSGEATSDVVGRYSRVALVAVIALVLTGGLAAFGEVGWSWRALTTTSYGQLLMVKLGLFVVAIVFAMLNRWRALPSLQSASVRGRNSEGAQRARGTLTTFVVSELLILVFVVVVTAWLVASVPARVAAEPRFVEATRSFGQGTVQLTIDPARQGTNVIHVYAFTSAGAPDDSVKDVDMQISNKKRDIAGLEIDLRSAGPGHFTTAGAVIPFSGTWNASLETRRSKFAKSTASVAFKVRARTDQ